MILVTSTIINEGLKKKTITLRSKADLTIFDTVTGLYYEFLAETKPIRQLIKSHIFFRWLIFGPSEIMAKHTTRDTGRCVLKISSIHGTPGIRAKYSGIDATIILRQLDQLDTRNYLLQKSIEDALKFVDKHLVELIDDEASDKYVDAR